MKKNKRSCGILLPVASLPSPYGIGAFSKEAYSFVDFLADAGQHYWQILPMGPTGYGDSPYQSFSAFAGNPYFIDITALIREGLLTKKEVDACDFGRDPEEIDYSRIYRERFGLLRKAYERAGISPAKEKDKAAVFSKDEKEAFDAFCESEKWWLEDYALYTAVKKHFGEKSWTRWDADIRLRKPKAVTRYKKQLADDMTFVAFLQYEFYKQWNHLKAYAHDRNVEIIGDLPIYVAFDSADTWSHPELFQLDGNNLPTGVSGCPPDAFSATGQLWGNPLYRWPYHEQTKFAWWISRIRQSFVLYDVVRIDHFRGFESYYSIPYGSKTAEFGTWEKGPGYAFFAVLKKELGRVRLIAEDLGYLTPAVRRLMKRCGYPGMKILQFAFDAREPSDYLPHNYEKNCVVYTGTHDNDTTSGWFQTIRRADRNFARKYMNMPGNRRLASRENVWDMIRLAHGSVADLSIIPMQDYLGLGSEARINIPSTLGGNWTWRMKARAINDALALQIRDLSELYGRCERR